jgi:proline dehydrogenase
LDELVYDDMEKLNKERCAVFNAYQMYRHDLLGRLKKAHRISGERAYLTGVKLVCGAYM